MNEWCSSSLSLKFSWASCSGAKWIRQDTSDSRWKKTNPSLRAFCYICLFHNQNRDAYNDETMPFAVSFADFSHQNCRFLLVLWITVRVVSDVMNIWSDTVSKWHILTTVHTWFCISYNLSEFNQIWIELEHCLKNHSRSLRFCSCPDEKKKKGATLSGKRKIEVSLQSLWQSRKCWTVYACGIHQNLTKCGLHCLFSPHLLSQQSLECVVFLSEDRKSLSASVFQFVCCCCQCLWKQPPRCCHEWSTWKCVSCSQGLLMTNLEDRQAQHFPSQWAVEDVPQS